MARENWKKLQTNTDPYRFFFLDETGAKTNMTRLYGRAMKGERCYDSAPDGRWERTTILSALNLSGETHSLIFDGALDYKMFEAYIEKILVPNLKPNNIVIMDNLSVHKSEKAKKLVEETGALYILLPPYSPDLNPIEKMWSKIKQILRGIKARTREALDAAITFALNSVTQNDAEGWFASCGYIKSQS